MNEPKVFGIGLSRTGTRSLVEALRILGYRAVHWPQSLRAIDEAEAAADITVACRFKFLDAVYRNARFILTTRDADAWFRSIRAHYAALPANRSLFSREAEFLCYGRTTFDEAAFRQAWIHHDIAVTQYFFGRPQSFLRLDVADGWEPLCDFLGKPIPSESFPWANRRF